MRSKGSRFTLGVWGLRVCSLDVAFTSATVRNRSQPFATVRNRSQPFATVHNRSQPSATVRNRPREVAMAVPMVSSAKGVHFLKFHMWRCSVSRVRRCTSWQSDLFCNVSKVVLCVAGAINTFATLSEDVLQFSWQAQHFRCVVLRVFANRIVRAVSSGDKVQIQW